jgi:hypothetical protein
VEEIDAHIEVSAHDLADYQAVRWALASLKPGPRWPELDTTWTREGSGDIPASLIYGECLAEAARLVDTFDAQSQGIRSDCLQERAENYRERFHDRRFYQEHNYLVWFHGKDHLVLLCRQLATNFPRRHYVSWAAEHIEATKHPDLQEFVSYVKSISKGLPVQDSTNI